MLLSKKSNLIKPQKRFLGSLKVQKIHNHNFHSTSKSVFHFCKPKTPQTNTKLSSTASKPIHLLQQKTMTTQSEKFKFAGIQMTVGADKQQNLERAKMMVQKAAHNGARLVCLPEMFNCPYSNDSFGPYSENIPDGPSTLALKEMAHTNGVFLVGGSIPEKVVENNQTKLYNTCLIINPQAQIIGKHRKIHLFDIDVPNQITFKESETLTRGDSMTVVELPWCKIGVGICYDMRFPELAQLMREKGAEFLVYPGAFNTTTGPAHWELLQRSRALDNQVYFSAVSPARNPESTYQAWGHSTVVSPWGDIVSTCDEKETIIEAEIDLEKVRTVRQNIPVLKQKRNDLYELREKELRK